MIRVTARDGSEMYINPDLIEIINETPDTHITLSNGNRYLVLESARELIERIVGYRARVQRHATPMGRFKYLTKREAQQYRPARRS